MVLNPVLLLPDILSVLPLNLPTSSFIHLHLLDFRSRTLRPRSPRDHLTRLPRRELHAMLPRRNAGHQGHAKALRKLFLPGWDGESCDPRGSWEFTRGQYSLFE